MAKVLGINAVFHDPAAAVVVDGETIAAVEEERFSRRKHGKEPVAFSTWELPEEAARWCLKAAGLKASELDAVAYSYDPALAPVPSGTLPESAWEDLRTLYVQRAPLFLKSALPGLDPDRVRFVPHHVAHAASAYLAAPFDSCAVLVLDGRGESASHLAGHFKNGRLKILHQQRLPDSLGLVYESLTQHLGFRRASDEYKVMALASYGQPAYLQELSESIAATGTAASAPWLRTGPGWSPPPSTSAGVLSTPTWLPPCSDGWRRSPWSWPSGCASRPVSERSFWPVAWR